MLPLKSILCPIDFSAPSSRAFEFAARWADETGATLHLIHVVHPAPVFSVEARSTQIASFDVASYERMVAASAEKQLRGTADSFQSRRAKAVPHVVVGNPAAEILRCAERLAVDLIVIAPQGRTAWDRWVTGSVAEKVVRHAPCPVLVVPARPPGSP